MKRSIFFISVLLVSLSAEAQFWFGPKVGGQLITPIYNNKARKDSFDITSKVNWHAGLALDYTTKNLFEVHTELVYMRVNNRSTSTDLFTQEVDSKTVNHYLSAPLMARMVFFQRSKIKVLAQAGPRLSYWLGGKGSLATSNLIEFGNNEIEYDIVFSDLKEEELLSSNANGKHLITKPNRLQYALDIGFGGVWEIGPTHRIILDVKYSFGHSYMSFNDGNLITDALTYEEDMEYNTNMMVLSMAYMYGYDVMGRRKGKSTSKVGNSKKKKRRR